MITIQQTFDGKVQCTCSNLICCMYKQIWLFNYTVVNQVADIQETVVFVYLLIA